MEKKTIDNKICRAAINPATSEEWDFECVAAPADNGQIRYSYSNEEYFNQVLKVSRENVDTTRLDSGLPILDNHPEAEDISILTTYGITVGYLFDERGLVVRCKFGARADEALRQDVKNGVIKTVSIEGTVQNYMVTRNNGEIPTYSAELWTPESLSFAPVPNDIGAQIEVKRAIEKQLTHTKEKTNYQKLTSKF